MDKKKGKMTDKMNLFCKEYMKDFNATAAAKRSGYSSKTAEIIGFENLRKPRIIETINKLKKDLMNDIDKIILDNILFWREVKENPKSRITDKLKASEYLGKYAAMFTEKVVTSVTIESDSTFEIVKKNANS